MRWIVIVAKTRHLIIKIMTVILRRTNVQMLPVRRMAGMQTTTTTTTRKTTTRPATTTTWMQPSKAPQCQAQNPCWRGQTWRKLSELGGVRHVDRKGHNSHKDDLAEAMP
mmetsp:Transcript_28127/g.74648  ORF Transcript_28127/g.74648 Transcript_28127/m.74648 type:complete len:110 (+) Transcript_28127:1147-1476(+)